MNKRTISTIGIIAAILMIVSGTELALARGGGGKGGGSCNGKGPGYNSGAGMSQAKDTYQYTHRQHNQFQYRHNNGTVAAQSGKRQMLAEQNHQGTENSSETLTPM